MSRLGLLYLHMGRGVGRADPAAPYCGYIGERSGENGKRPGPTPGDRGRIGITMGRIPRIIGDCGKRDGLGPGGGKRAGPEGSCWAGCGGGGKRGGGAAEDGGGLDIFLSTVGGTTDGRFDLGAGTGWDPSFLLTLSTLNCGGGKRDNAAEVGDGLDIFLSTGGDTTAAGAFGLGWGTDWDPPFLLIFSTLTRLRLWHCVR